MSDQLEILYPCLWNYRIIGTDEEAIRRVVAALAGEQDYRLVRSNTSATGRYVALLLSLVVQDEAQRLGVFQTLRDEETIRYVL